MLWSICSALMKNMTREAYWRWCGEAEAESCGQERREMHITLGFGNVSSPQSIVLDDQLYIALYLPHGRVHRDCRFRVVATNMSPSLP